VSETTKASWIEKIEVDSDLPILRVTDRNLYTMSYLLADDARLVLGQVYQQHAAGHVVTFFIPAGEELPHVLKVVAT
jgi:hypothetical protein